MAFWHPITHIDDDALRRGLRAFQGDGICSQIRDSLLSGPLLVGYALLLGASNAGVGLLSALAPATQILQLPAVALIERWRMRKAICWWAACFARVAWLGVLALPWAVPAGARTPALFGLLLLASALGTVSAAAWNPWIRDFLPEEVRTRAFARRMAIATAIGAGLSLLAGLAVEELGVQLDSALGGYVVVLGAGAAAALLGLVFLGRIPEPVMPPAGRRPWADIMRAPLRHREFRALVAFLGTWTFAIHLSTPFFTVYLLRRFGLPMAVVIALAVLSQVTAALVLRAWGNLADRFSTLTVLRVSCAGFLLSVACWPMVGLLRGPWLVLAGLALIHILAGLTTAGVNLGSGTVVMELAPRGAAAGYLATNALIVGAASALAPVIAGLSADWLETQRLSVTVAWTSTLDAGTGLALRPLDLHGLDFLFVATVLVGLYAIHRILAVTERAMAGRRVVLAALLEQMREQMPQPLRAITTVPSVRDLAYFPFSVLGRMLPERRRAAAAHGLGYRRRARDRREGPPSSGSE
ncbi:MAG: MFS transporter [Gemmatimonadales bacterium]|nr:MFS transporter [Gemmatimonadales bacterium]